MTDSSPFTFEVIRDNLLAACDEMAADLQAIAYSPIIREAGDFTTGFADRRGQLVAQAARLNTPGHYNSIASSTKALLSKTPVGEMAPGDVFITNDPWVCAGHLPDIFLFMPVFAGRNVVAFAVCGAHHIDVGGMVAGSTTADATEIFQEGLQLPTIKFAENGQPLAGVMDIIRANVRIPEVVTNDLRAQMAVLERGAERLGTLGRRYGFETVLHTFERTIALAERQAREAIASLPDGSYSWSTCVDDDGQTDEPVAIKACVTIDGEMLQVDYKGSSPQVAGGINLTAPFRDAYTHVAIRHFLPLDIAHNEGTMRPISISAPLGTVLNPRRPAAVAGRAPVVSRMVDAVVACLSQAVPARALAGYGGTLAQPVWSGDHTDGAGRFIFMDTTHGGLGGRSGLDGESCISFPFDVGNHPAEYLELNYPVRVRRLQLRADSEGPGEFRGGFGAEKEYEVLSDLVHVSITGDRMRFRPHGLQGGCPGETLQHVLIRDGKTTSLGSKTSVTLRRGDRLIIRTPGGGGLGPPHLRARAAVLHDVHEGLITLARALNEYGVVVSGSIVDQQATAARRRQVASGEDGEGCLEVE